MLYVRYGGRKSTVGNDGTMVHCHMARWCIATRLDLPGPNGVDRLNDTVDGGGGGEAVWQIH